MDQWFNPHHRDHFASERRSRCTIRLEEVERSRNDLAHGFANDKHDLHGQLHDAILPDHDRGGRWDGDSRQWVAERWKERHYQGQGQPSVRLCQLDRQRNRVLYWDEQSSLNHNGRAHYRDGRFYSESNTNSNPNAYSKSDCNSDANGDSDSYLYSNTYHDSYVHADADAGGESHAYSYRYSDRNSYLYSNSYRDSHVHADADAGGESHTNTYGDPDSYANPHGDGDTYTDTSIRGGRFQSRGWAAGTQLDEAAGVGEQLGDR